MSITPSTVRPTVTTQPQSLGVAAARAADAKDTNAEVAGEILAVTEDFVEYVARRGRGITVATPARRALRDKVEACVKEFLTTATSPTASEERAPARSNEIRRQLEALDPAPAEQHGM